MFAGKRGQEELLSVIIQLSIVILLFIAIVVFINSTMSGKLIIEQMSAKQLALILDSARQDTTLSIASDLNISIKDNKAIAGSGEKLPYEYTFYNPLKINMIQKKEFDPYIFEVKGE